jgi:hypothetical protein
LTTALTLAAIFSVDGDFSFLSSFFSLFFFFFLESFFFGDLDFSYIIYSGSTAASLGAIYS